MNLKDKAKGEIKNSTKGYVFTTFLLFWFFLLPFNLLSQENVQFLFKWGSVGNGSSQFIRPASVAVDPRSGDIYIADSGNHRVQKFTSSGDFVTAWGSYCEMRTSSGCNYSRDASGAVIFGDGQFLGPSSVAIDSLGDIYVADDGNHRIQKFTSNGTFITKWGSQGFGVDGLFSFPVGITIDSFDNIYVLDRENYRVQKFTNNGVFITKWGSQGSGDGEFLFPANVGINGIAVDSSNNVYVTDDGNHRIQKFTSNGTFITKWGSRGTSAGQFINPRGISLDTSGNVYVTDSTSQVHKFNSNGVFLTRWGSRGNGDGQFILPLGIAINNLNKIYIADFDGHRIQVFSFAPPPDTTSPNTLILSVTDANNNGIPSNNTTTSSIGIKFAFSGTDNVTPSDQLVFECSLDGGVFTPCVSLQSYFNLSLGTHTFVVRAKDAVGNIDQTPAMFSWIITLPLQFYSEVKNAPNWLRLRATPGTTGKLESDVLKTMPNKWALKVLNTKDTNGNNVDLDGYRWYQVEDRTDGAVGWMAAQSLTDEIIYLDYHANLQTDLENKAAVQLTTSYQRKPVILDAINTYYAATTTDNSLHGGGGGRDGNNNFQTFIQGAQFPKELVLAIASQESGSYEFNNEICSTAQDGGIGIMQITSTDLKGLGSGLDNFSRKNDCRSNAESFSKYYSNAFQGIYANIKDGFRTLQTKYRQKCPKDSIALQGYTFTCQDIEKILTTWGYNGFAKDKDTGVYTGNYLKYVANKLRNLTTYFTGIAYSNTDNLIEKLEVANDNKQVIRIYSPATFNVIDELGRITGVQNSIAQEEIPNSLYETGAEGAVIFFPSASYRYRVTGTSTGTYKFTVDYTKSGILKAFNAIDIPIVSGEIHEYIIDWDALDRGERGVTVNIDYSGDGTVDQVIISDSTLTDIESPQITATPLSVEYIYNSQVQLQFSATDDVSGLASVSATLNNTPIQSGQFINLNQLGVNAFVVTAVDNDGNISTLTETFRVIYNFGGFLPPIKIDGSGVYKLGRTLPVKFRLTDVNGNSVPTALAHLYVAKISDGILGTDEVPLSTSSADTGNQFRYDLGGNQYMYNLSTDTMSPGTWQLKAVLNSGQILTTVISIR